MRKKNLLQILLWKQQNSCSPAGDKYAVTSSRMKCIFPFYNILLITLSEICWEMFNFIISIFTIFKSPNVQHFTTYISVLACILVSGYFHISDLFVLYVV